MTKIRHRLGLFLFTRRFLPRPLLALALWLTRDYR